MLVGHLPDKEDLDVSEAYKGSRKVVWWLGSCGHAWRESIACRVDRHDLNCPYCANRRAWRGYNDLETVAPDIAALWHPHMNRKITPRDVTAHSSKVVWWKGPGCGHIFKMKVSQRAKASAGCCPICAGRLKPERQIKGL